MANSIRLECLIVTGVTCSKWVASNPLVSVDVNQFGILCTTYRRLDPLIKFSFRLIECVDFCQSQIHNSIDLSFVTVTDFRFARFFLLLMFCRERANAKRGTETLFYVNIWCSAHTESEVNEVVDSFSRFLENTRLLAVHRNEQSTVAAAHCMWYEQRVYLLVDRVDPNQWYDMYVVLWWLAHKCSGAVCVSFVFWVRRTGVTQSRRYARRISVSVSCDVQIRW